ncbi:hypothetical protein J8J14_20315 [Roseomonas sp. SSH11]|uniref:Uncharacterized protein n=1 Tax=Pararoseomonas baculiformis TaxID=2820812 RepID=A0ABS4AJD2_9PROT|nr:hypothetical protein [Pararoseomonas baculiformis]MBP0447125.1 hypothetical protein [Pararoseomonas baculiformis]
MILISGIVHRKPELIREQILLYNAAMGGEAACHHILHVSADGVREGLLQKLDLPHNVTINPTHLHTRRPTFLACHVSNLLHAMRAGMAHTHVYLHTESDIPYRHGLGAQIRAHDLGLAEPAVFRPDKARSTWAEPVAADWRLRRFVETAGDGNIYTSRYEGMFAARALMTEILAQMMAAWPMDEHHWRGDYPYEEFGLPTVTAAVVRNRAIRRTRHAVLTTSSSRAYGLKDREMLRADSIALLQAEPPEIFSAKFAPHDLNSPVRAFARRSLGLEE